MNSDIKVDPVFLKVLDQDNRVEMQLAAVPEIESEKAEKGEEHAQTAEMVQWNWRSNLGSVLCWDFLTVLYISNPGWWAAHWVTAVGINLSKQVMGGLSALEVSCKSFWWLRSPQSVTGAFICHNDSVTHHMWSCTIQRCPVFLWTCCVCRTSHVCPCICNLLFSYEFTIFATKHSLNRYENLNFKSCAHVGLYSVTCTSMLFQEGFVCTAREFRKYTVPFFKEYSGKFKEFSCYNLLFAIWYSML